MEEGLFWVAGCSTQLELQGLRSAVGPKGGMGSPYGAFSWRGGGSGSQSGLRLPDLEGQGHYQPAVWPWESYLLPLSLCILGAEVTHDGKHPVRLHTHYLFSAVTLW